MSSYKKKGDEWEVTISISDSVFYYNCDTEDDAKAIADSGKLWDLNARGELIPQEALRRTLDAFKRAGIENPMLYRYLEKFLDSDYPTD